VGKGDRDVTWVRTCWRSDRKRAGHAPRKGCILPRGVSREFGLPSYKLRRPAQDAAVTWSKRSFPRDQDGTPDALRTEGLWIKCPAATRCSIGELERNLQVARMQHHMRIGARDRLNRFLDSGSGASSPWKSNPKIRCGFATARISDRLTVAEAGGEKDALIVMAGRCTAWNRGVRVRIQVLGSMVRGRRALYARPEYCLEHRQP